MPFFTNDVVFVICLHWVGAGIVEFVVGEGEGGKEV